MGEILHNFPSKVVRPHPSTAMRSNSLVDAPCLLRFGTKRFPFSPALPMGSFSTSRRPRSALKDGELSKSPAGYLTINSDRQSLIGELRGASADVKRADSLQSMPKTCLNPQCTSSCSSLQKRSLAPTGINACYVCMLRCRPLMAQFFSSPLMRNGMITDENWAFHSAKSGGRVLLIGMIFVLLNLGHGSILSQHALAAPVATTTDSKRRNTEGQEVTRSSRQFLRDRREGTEESLAGLGDIEKRAEDGNTVFNKRLEEISVADRKEVEAYLKYLRQEGNLLGKQVDRAIDDYLSTRAKLEGFGSDVATLEKEAQEGLLKEKVDVLVSYRSKLLQIVAAAKRISQRMKQIDAQRKGVVEQDGSSQLSKIASDLEQLKRVQREHDLLPLAAKVEEAGQPAAINGSAAVIERIEQEQKISTKLEDLLEKLAGKVDNRTWEEDLELEYSMREVRDLILDESRWQDEDEELRSALLEDREPVKDISVKEREEILIARDRLLNETWYDEKRKRWEMHPAAALHAVQKKLIGRARVRHDWGVSYLTVKGDDREYFVDNKTFDAEYEAHGGFRMLYTKLIASGVPTSVEVMWIPLQEWKAERLVQLPFKVVWWLFKDFWDSSLVASVRPWYYKTFVGAFEEVMVRFGFPIIHKVLPQKIRVLLGFELAEGAEAAEPTDIVTWQQEAQKHVDTRYAEGSGSPVWWISLPVRCYVVGLPLLIVLRIIVTVLVVPFRPQRLAMNEVEWKEKKQAELEKKLQLQTKKMTIDPIKNVFDKMKRVKRPEISLKDFAGIDIIKEEINEIISFLKNPKLFREMGARPPRGVLIVGDSGTGKTTLALAIAAEARVPMVELQGSELEGGAWVGQGASNVRELFKTARETAPLIIFMDDFDHFAGVRGATSDTRKQDHESLINQLLVELDGFETQEGVVLVATTSRPFAIDEALRRPGRMDRTIQLPMPNKREREQILRQAAQKTMDAHLVNYVDWSKVAEKTAGLTPARLKYVPEGLEGSAVSYKIADEEELFFLFEQLAAINKITPRWIKESKWTKRYNEKFLDWLGLRVTKDDMESAVEYLDVFGQSKPGIELYDPPYVWTREFKFPHAVWAAGKGLIALLLPDFDSVDQIWLDPTSWEGIAFTKFTKKMEGGYEETGTLTRSYSEKELVSYFGASLASRMLLPFGENNSLCKFELDNAKEIATRMVMEYGWAPDASPMIYMADGSGISLAIGDEHERDVANKINQLFFRACEKASHMLEQNQPVLEGLLEHLLKFDMLNKEDLKQILDERGAVFEEEPFSLLPLTRSEIGGVSTNGTGRSGMDSTISVA